MPMMLTISRIQIPIEAIITIPSNGSSLGHRSTEIAFFAGFGSAA
jgi:hypothetical protein